ncbi:MAG: preprotein translocase subunit SecG [Chthonomonas sp.]|nr:preprotein translocase subunit SecG [Chthonomonas sp.]
MSPALYNVLLSVAVLVAVLFIILVIITGKGDAMSGGGSIRTTYKGKQSIEDQIGRMTMMLGIGFMGLMLILDVVNSRMK